MPSSGPLNTSHSPKDSQSPQSSQEGRLPKAFEQTPAPLQSPLAYISASTQASPVIPLPPLSATIGTALYTLPPLAHTTRTPASTILPFDILSRENTADDHVFQNLQRDNANLISAYAEAKLHIADLNRTVQASSLEFNKLIKERQGLKASIDILEAEIEELQNSIEQSQRHGIAKDTQYSQIVEMSSRLQIQATADAQQRKSEKDQWSCEKGSMQQTITTLRSEVRSLRRTYSGRSPPTRERPRATAKERYDEILDITTSSPSRLEDELRKLQTTNSDLEVALDHVREEHAKLVHHIEKLGDVGMNIQRHLLDAGAEVEVSRSSTRGRPFGHGDG